MKFIEKSEQTNKKLKNLDRVYEEHSEMSPSEQAFLTELILQYKPKKLLEVGVAAGASSVLMLNAIKDDKNASFYSVDYRTEYYRNKEKNTGFIVEEYPELEERRQFFTGALAGKFLDEIGGGIDFCLIDTVHSYPGEILDFIMILPYLTKDAIVVFHDTNLHTFHGEKLYVNNHLISAIRGEKLIPKTFDASFFHHIERKKFNTPFSNITAVQLDGMQKKHIWDLFNLLTTKWAYLPQPEDLVLFKYCLKKHYDVYFYNFFNDILTYQKIKNFAPTPESRAMLAQQAKPVQQKKDTDVKAPKKVFYDLPKEERRKILKKKRKEDPYRFYADAKFIPVRWLRFFFTPKNK